MSGLRIDRVITSGKFTLDGGTWDVDNNIWLGGDDHEVVIVDAAHDAAPILAAVGDRTVRAIVVTHGHNDHIGVAPELSAATGAQVLLHPGDDMLWQQTHPDVPHGDLADEQEIPIAGTALRVHHTPGHSPGSSVLYAPEAGVLFSGDTLFLGGPGATGRSYSSYPVIVASIRRSIFTLDPAVQVCTGHGDATTVGAEADTSRDWPEP